MAVRLSEAELETFVTNPVRGLQILLRAIHINENQIGATNQDVLTAYLRDYDIVNLKKRLNGYSGTLTTPAQIENIIKLYMKALAYQDMTLSRSNESYRKLVNTYLAFVKKSQEDKKNNLPAVPPPSETQMKAVSELARFLMSPINERHYVFDNVAAIKAPAGAGKTTVVFRLLKEVLGYGPDTIMSGSTTQASAQLIAEQVSSTYGANEATKITELLEEGKLPPAVRLLVLDEIGALGVREMQRLAAAIVSHNLSKPKQQIKVLFMYDSNQLTAGNRGDAVIDINPFYEVPENITEYHNGDEVSKRKYKQGLHTVNGQYDPRFASGVNFPHHIFDVSPLIATYRSPLSEIIDAQNAFKSTQVVESIQTAANVDTTGSMVGAMGTMASKTNGQLLTKLVSSYNSNPGRTRMVVVGTDEKKARYMTDLATAGAADVQVLTAAECRGLKAQEVYVDIENTDSHYYSEPVAYNQAMYTATSRAETFLYISGIASSRHTVDASLPTKVNEVLKSKDIKYDTVIDALTQRSKAFEILGAEEPVTPPKPQEPQAPPVTPEEAPEILNGGTPIEEDEPPIEESPAPPVGGDAPLLDPTSSNWHKISAPQSEAFNDARLGSIRPEEKVFYAREVDNGMSRIRVFVAGPTEGTFRQIGILMDHEVGSVSKVLGADLTALPPTKFSPDLLNDTTGRNIFRAIGPQPVNIADARVSSASTDIEYKYDSPLPTFTFKGTPDDPNGLKEIAKYMTDALFGTQAGQIVNLDDFNSRPEEFMRLIVYENEADRNADFPNVINKPRLNIPYLIVHGLKTNKGKTMARQFIQLNATVLDSNTEAADRLNLKAMQELSFVLGAMDDLLRTLNLPASYNKIRMGEAIVTGNDIFYPYHAFIVELSNIYRKQRAGENPTTLEMVRQKNSAIYQLLPDIPVSSLPKELLEVAYKIDVYMHGNAIGSPKEKSRRTYSGPAQQAFSRIAKQNLIITLPDGTNKILRDFYATEDRSGRDIEVSTGASILGPIKFVRDGGRSYNPSLKASLVRRLKDYKDSLERRGHTNSPRYELVDKLVQQPEYSHIKPFTLPQFMSFIGAKDASGKYTGISEGFGLRMPLPKTANNKFYLTNNINDIKLSDYVETNLTQINPTRIIIEVREGGLVKTEEGQAFAAAISAPVQIGQFIRQSTADSMVLAKEILDKFSEDAVEAFIDRMTGEGTTGFMPLARAIEEYRENAKEQIGYEQKSHSIFTAIQSLRRSQTSTSMVDRALTAIKQSHAVVDVGKNQGNYAARDFIRAAIYMELLPNLDKKDIYDLLDFARSYYRDKAGIAHQLDLSYLLSAYGPVDAAKHAEAVFYAYMEAFDQLGVRLEPMLVNKSQEFLDILTHVETLVKASTTYRESERSGAAPIDVSAQFRSWLSAMNSASKMESTDALEMLVEDPTTAHHVKQFNDFVGDKEFNWANLTANLAKVNALLDIERSMILITEEDNIGELITEDEASDLAYQFNPPNLVQQLKALFTGQIDHPQALRFVDWNLRQKQLGDKLWGQYKNGITSMVKHASGKVGTRVVRHELFHKIFWEFMTPEERFRALDLAQAQWGPADAVKQEERLAEAFSDFQRPDPSWLMSLWEMLRNLWRLIGFTYNNMSSIDDLFKSIEAGYYKGKGKPANVERSMLYIGTQFDSVDHFTFAKQALFEAFNKLFYERNLDTRVLSYEEAVNGAFEMLNNYTYSGVAASDIEFQKSAIDSLTKNEKVKRAFIEYYFGASNVADAQRVARYKEKGAELETLRSEIERLTEIMETDPESFTVDDEEALIDAETQEANIADYIFDSELQDPEDSVTGRVKQRFVGIKYDKGDRKEYADFGSVYNLVINVFKQIPVDSLDNLLSGLLQRLRPFSGNRMYKTVRTATGQHLLKIIQNIYDDYKGLNEKYNPTRQVSFRKDVNVPLLYAITSDDESSQDVSYELAKANPTKYKIFELTTEDSFQDLLDRIHAETGIEKQVLAKTYYHFEDINFLRALITAAGSLREAKPFVGVQEWYYGQYKTRYIANRASSTTQVVESRLTSSFIAYALKRENTLFTKEFIEETRAANTIDAKKAVINKFISLIELSGLGRALKESPDELIEEIHDSMKFAIPQMQENFLKYHIDTSESDETYMSLYDIIADQGSFISALIQSLSNSSSLIENASYIRGDGKKSFLFQDAS